MGGVIAMDIKRCKGCKYFRSYFHWFSTNGVRITHRCWWAMIDAEKVKKRKNVAEKRRIEMTRDDAMYMLKDQSDRAELLSGLSGAGRFIVMINPDTGYSVHISKSSESCFKAMGWEPVAEFENGEQVEVHRFHLHLK